MGFVGFMAKFMGLMGFIGFIGFIGLRVSKERGGRFLEVFCGARILLLCGVMSESRQTVLILRKKPIHPATTCQYTKIGASLNPATRIQWCNLLSPTTQAPLAITEKKVRLTSV